MSPEARGNTPFGAVKCVNAEKDDWIGNIEVKTAGDRGVEDYYCLVQWDDPDCSGTGGYVWMNNHMPTEGDCESLWTCVRTDTNYMVLISSQGLAPFNLTLSVNQSLPASAR
jgi:hypothetical protein